MKDLTPRQKALYQFLLEQGDRWTFQQDICYALKEWYNCSFSCSDFHNSTTRQILTKDIRALNESDSVPMIIFSNANGVKIATKEEFEIYIQSEFSAAVRRLERVKRKARKGNLDGQIKMNSNEDHEVIRSFLK